MIDSSSFLISSQCVVDIREFTNEEIWAQDERYGLEASVVICRVV